MIVPVILSGGKGTRLWPVSREAHPKPFMKMADGLSLLQSTFLRSAGLPGVENVVTVTNRDYYFQTRDEIDALDERLDGTRVGFLLESSPRNTAPAVLLAARQVADQFGPEAIILVLPSDHLIAREEAFRNAVDSAAESARSGRLVTFGIRPLTPETGYGYIECSGEVSDLEVQPVARFVEKPDLERAREYLRGGRHLWNSGMFCFRADAILDAARECAPDLANQADKVWSASAGKRGNSFETTHLDPDTLADADSISIDYAIMEKADNVSVVPADLGWSDVGSWTAISELTEADEHGNRVVGDAVLVDAKDNYIQSGHRLVAAVGVENLVIVDTEDALLVGRQGDSQRVKDVVEELRLRGHEAGKLHKTVHRPWGTYTVIEEGEKYKIKRLVVKPGAALSLQMHHHRSEHWVLVEGTAKVRNGDEEFLLEKDQSTYIPAGNKHRLENPGKVNVSIIETQTGDYLGEDDIVRFEDRYGRTPGK